MQLKRTSLFLLLLPLTLPTPTRAVDPLTIGLVAAASAAIGTAGYLAYDYTHYSSEQNCKNAIHDFCRKVHEPNIFVRAAEHRTIEPLISVYKKLVYSNYNNGYSLGAVELTKQVVKQAYAYVDTLNAEYTRIKRYRHYSTFAYMHEIQQCEQTLRTIDEFYKNMGHSSIYAYSYMDIVKFEIFKELEHNVLAELRKNISTNNYSSGNNYPLHTYVTSLQQVSGIYKKFIQDNNGMNSESSRLIHQCSEVIHSIKTSSEYYIEEQKMQLENLRDTYNSLQQKIAHKQQENMNLHLENNALATKNQILYRMVEELRNIRYCHACQAHTTVYFNNNVIHDMYYAHPETTIHIHQNSPIFQPVSNSSHYYQEELAREIEHLKAVNSSLEFNLSQLKRVNSSLRHENNDLSDRNRRLNRLVEELKSIRYCHDCQSHITIYLHTHN